MPNTVPGARSTPPRLETPTPAIIIATAANRTAVSNPMTMPRPRRDAPRRSVESLDAWTSTEDGELCIKSLDVSRPPPAALLPGELMERCLDHVATNIAGRLCPKPADP